MPNTLKIKRGTNATIPQGQLAEPLFTTDTYDLYIGKGAGGNQRIQNYIASGTSSQFLKGDGSLDSTVYQATSEKGQNNGYASLDAGGKIPASQLPSSVIEYKGTWNASTNTPTLADGTGDAGDVYIVSVGGTQNLGSGSITFAAGDWVMYNGSVWQKSTGSNAVASVNGQTGVVTITFDQLSPMTTLGDLIYGGASGAGTRLAGNITTTKKFLSQTGNSTISAAPSWETVTKSDVGLGNVENTALSTWAGSTNITTLGTITTGIWNGTTIAIADGGTGATTKAAAFNALSPMTTLGDIIYGGASGTGTRLAGSTSASKRFLTQTGDGTNSAAPAWGTVSASDITGSALTKTDDTNVTLTLGGSASTALLNAASLTLGWTGTLAVSRGGTGASSFGSNEIIYGNSASALQSSNTFTYSPTGVFLINNSISAGGIATNFTSTVNAAANNSILYGVRISPTFNNGAFTGVTQRALGVFGDVYINGAITSGAWNGSVIGSNYGGAGTVSGILKANGSGVVSAAVAGTDYVIPSALNSYLPLAGGTMTGQLQLRNGGVYLNRDYDNNSIWFSGTADDNHVLWNDYNGGPTTRTGASGFDGIKWNTYRGIHLRGGGSGQYNCLIIENSSSNTNDHTVKLYAANTLRFQTTTSGATVTGTLSGSVGNFSGNFTLNGTVYTDKTTGFVAYSIFQNGNKLTYAGGSGGHQFNDDANTVNLISLLNNGSTSINATAAAYGLTVTNVQDSSQGLLVRSSDNDTTLYLARFQSSVGATSTTWVDRFSIAKNGSTVIGDNIPAVNVRLWVKGEDQTASNYAMDVTDSLGQSIAWFRNDKAIRFYGGLTGTSATFQTTITPLVLRGTNAATMWTEYYYNTSTLSGYIGSGDGLLSGANASDFILRSQADLVIASGGNNRRLTIASGGAATFSSTLRVQDAIYGADGTSTSASIRFYNSNTGLYYPGSDALGIITNGTEKVRITSGGAVQATNNLTANSPSAGNTGEGIIAGTSFKIDAGGTGQKAKMYVVSKDLSDTYGSGLQIQFANQADDKGFGFNLTTAGTYETYVKDSGASWIRRMIITQGGNIGINTSSAGSRLTIFEGDIRLYKQHVNGNTASWRANILFTDEVDRIGARIVGLREQWDGAPMALTFETGGVGTTTEYMRLSSAGYLKLKTVSSVYTSTTHRLDDYNRAEGGNILTSGNASSADSILLYSVSQGGQNGAATAMAVGKNSSTSRSINAGGTINASGADYAEYMTKSIDETINKGDIVGVDSNGLLTNIFDDSISFVVKSTNPSYVGGDDWASIDKIGKVPEENTIEKEMYDKKLEELRSKVDRIAFSGQVPCNIYNAKVGDYIIPIKLENGKIGGKAVSNPTLDEYRISVGKVWKIMDDGRSWIAVKIG